MKISMKLIGAFCLVALLVGVVGFIGYIGLHRTMTAADLIMEKKVPVADASMESMIALISGRDLMGEFLISNDLAALPALEQEFNQEVDSFHTNSNFIKENARPEIAAKARQVDESFEKFVENARELMSHHRASLEAKIVTASLMEKYDKAVDSCMSKMESYEEELTRNNQIDPKVDAAMESKSIMYAQSAIVEEYKGLTDPAAAAGLRDRFNALSGEFDKMASLLTPEIVKIHQEMVADAIGSDMLFDHRDEILALQRETLAHMGQVDQFSSKGDETMDEVEQMAGADMQSAMNDADSIYSFSNMLVLIVSIIGFVIAFGFGWIISRSIALPMQKTVSMISEMSKGHLGMRLQMNRADEIGDMAKAMDTFADDLQNVMVVALEKLANGDLTYTASAKDDDDVIGKALTRVQTDLDSIFSQMRQAGDQVAMAAGQVSDASQSLSQGSTESASSLEQISSSMNEMASQTKANAENASQANQLADGAKAAAGTGNAQMAEMIMAMSDIEDSSKNISKIIKVIDEIAFQTNLLALNAAVEAARAGQHGKGFAVVAEEVRNLAARSAKAARETAELIEGSVHKTKKGTEIANNTAEALGNIVREITKVSDLVAEIAASSSEQAKGISEVSQGLGQIDQVTQQNTANAEESAAAAEELSAQAAQLKALIARFKLMSNTGTSRKQAALPQPKREAPRKSRPASADDGWGNEAVPTGKQKPEQLIALDDDEFGKY